MLSDKEELLREAFKQIDLGNPDQFAEALIIASHELRDPDGRRIISPFIGEQGADFAKQIAMTILKYTYVAH